MDERVTDVIRRLREKIPGAVVGGGSVRDAILGIPIKDIDVFLRIGEIQDKKFSVGEFIDYELPEIFPESCIKAEIHRSNPFSQLLNSSGATNLKQDFIIHDTTVQFCFIKQFPVQHIKQMFDFTINEAWYDGKKINKTKFFDDSARSRILMMSKTKPKNLGNKQLFLERVKYLCTKLYMVPSSDIIDKIDSILEIFKKYKSPQSPTWRNSVYEKVYDYNTLVNSVATATNPPYQQEYQWTPTISTSSMTTGQTVTLSPDDLGMFPDNNT